MTDITFYKLDTAFAPLSPATQVVWKAFTEAPICAEVKLAAALRAAADQMVPHSELIPQQDLESRREAMVWGMVNQTQVTRQQLLAIAAELEGAPDDQG